MSMNLLTPEQEQTAAIKALSQSVDGLKGELHKIETDLSNIARTLATELAGIKTTIGSRR